MRLIVVELRRALARRMNRGLFLLLAGCLVVTGVWVFGATKDSSAVERERIQQEEIQRARVEGDIAECVQEIEDRIAATPPAPTTTTDPTAPSEGIVIQPGVDEWTPIYDGTASPELIREYCELQAGMYPGGSYRSGASPFDITHLWIAPEDESDARAGGTSSSWLLTPAVILLISGLAVGASLIGAEWQSGNMVVFLTWEPRRTRVLLAKVLAAAVVVGVAAFVLQVLLTLVLFPTAMVKGTTAGVDGEWIGQLGWAIGRISLVAACASVIGAALAMIGRRTALALGVAFVYLAILESLLGVWQEWFRPLMLSFNATIFFTGMQVNGEDWTRSPTTAGLTLAAYAAVSVAVAAVAFHRRDFAG